MAMNPIHNPPANVRSFMAVVVLGVFLRLAASRMGWNWDMDAWWAHANNIGDWRHFYQNLPWNNYAPGWSIIVYTLNALPCFGLERFLAFRYKVAVFLTEVDVCIAYVLWREYSLRVAALFLLNPISIIITGYHSQIDNIYVLCGLVAVRAIRKDEQKINYMALSVIGLSMVIKHGLFLFPGWFAIRALMQKNLRLAVASIIVPFAVFFASFIPFCVESGAINTIYTNIFLYRGFNNAPFWYGLKPFWVSLVSQDAMIDIGFVLVFAICMAVLGFCWRKRALEEMFLLYLVALVTFSSAVANQYLTIPNVAIAVFPNIFFVLFALLGGLFLLGDGSGMHVGTVTQITTKWVGHSGDWYNLLVALLALGLLYSQLPGRFRDKIRWLFEKRRAGAVG